MNMSKLLSNYVTESTQMLQPAYVGTTNTAELTHHSVVDTVLSDVTQQPMRFAGFHNQLPAPLVMM